MPPNQRLSQVEATCEKLLASGKTMAEITGPLVGEMLKINGGHARKYVMVWKKRRAIAKVVRLSLPLDQVHCVKELQIRAARDIQGVDEYAERQRDGSEPPAMKVVKVEGDYYLTDGFQRYEALIKNEQKSGTFDVREGTMEDALDEACRANAEHGIPRSADSKRNAIRVYCSQDRHKDKTDQVIARELGLTRTVVQKHRSELLRELADQEEAERLAKAPKSDTNGDGGEDEEDEPDDEIDLSGKGASVNGTPSRGRRKRQPKKQKPSQPGPQERERQASGNRYAPTPKEQEDVVRCKVWKHLKNEKTKAAFGEELAYRLRMRPALDVLKKAHDKYARPGRDTAARTLLATKIAMLLRIVEVEAALMCAQCKGEGCRKCNGKGYELPTSPEK